MKLGFMLNQKGLAHIFLLLILGLGIIAGVYLVSHPTIFKPKAAGANIEIGTNECVRQVEGRKTLVCGDVPLKLVSPLETGNAAPVSDAGFSLVKTVLAQESKGGVGYSCEKEGGDKLKIYHQKCNFQLLGINFCELNFPYTKYDLIQESCDIGQRCDSTTTDLFNTIAKCVPDENSQPIRNLQPPIFVQPPIPTPTFTSIPRAVATPTPIPTVTNTSRATVTPTSTPIPAVTTTATPTATPPPTPDAIASATPRVTKGYRIAEDLTALKTAKWHDDYKAGGITYIYPLSKDTKPGGTVTLFVEFRDQDEKTIKFSNGNTYASVSIDFSAPEVSPSPTAARVIAATTCKVAENANRKCTLPTEKCEITTLADIGNCTNEQLLGTLTKEQLGTIDLARMKTFGSDDLMCFFPREVVARMDAGTLKDLPNEDLLLLGDASGDCKTFLSSFSCDRIVLLPSEYQALTSCGR